MGGGPKIIHRDKKDDHISSLSSYRFDDHLSRLKCVFIQ